MTCCISASTPSTLRVWGGVESVVNKGHFTSHTTTRYCIAWWCGGCGVREILGVVNIGDGRGVVTWQRR